MEYRSNHSYMALVNVLRERLHSRRCETARLIETHDLAGILQRAAELRAAYQSHLIDSGLTPHPLSPATAGILEFPDYVIEKITLQSVENLPIPLNLYLPRIPAEKHPAVIVTSGHWLHAKQTAAHQRLCANLAKKGIAAVIFDPIYQGERCPWSEAELLEMFGPVSEDMWMVGLHMFAGNLAYMLGRNLGALFLHEAVCVLDYLCTRPEIDIDRLGAVGQSGGGTQACYLAAMDQRIRLYVPIQCLSSLSITLEDGIGDCEQSLFGISANGGTDQCDILWAALPKPVLHSAGRYDFFSLEGAYSIASEMSGVYRVLGHPENYTLLTADCAHELSQESRTHVYGRLTEYFLGKRDAQEYQTAILDPVQLHCLTGFPKNGYGPERVYWRQLQQLTESRAKDRETLRIRVQNLLAPSRDSFSVEQLAQTGTQLTFSLHSAYNKYEYISCCLTRRPSSVLCVINAPEEQLPSEKEISCCSVLSIAPWAMDTAYQKKRMGYDLETCLFNTAAVLGENLAARRVSQILSAVDYAIRSTGASEVLFVGVEAGCLPMLLAVCADEHIHKTILVRCQVSFDDLFAQQKYFLNETSIVPGLLAIADIPALCAAADAEVWNPLHSDHQPYTKEEILCETRLPCFWQEHWQQGLGRWLADKARADA